MEASDKDKLAQAISILQSLSIGGGGSSHSSDPAPGVSLPPLEDHISSFTNKSKELEPQIQALTNSFVQALNLMNTVIAASGNAKKFSAEKEALLKDKFMSIIKKNDPVYKNQQFVPHAKAMQQIISTTFWVFAPSPEFIFKGGIEAADFNALKFKTKKNMGHNQWYNEVLDTVKALFDYVKKNYPGGLTFNFNGQNDWSGVIQGSSSTKASIAQQQGQSKPSQSAPQQKPQVKNKPKRQLMGMNWNIQNFEEGEIVITKDEVKMMQGVFVQNCKECVIRIEGKFKNIMINKCEKVGIVVGSCISGVQMVNCGKMKLQVLEKVPAISIDKCQTVNIILNGQNKFCDIVSSKATELNICYTTGNNNTSKDYSVSEQVVTNWNEANGKFETKVYDKFM